MNIIIKAVDFAAKKHRNQRRKNPDKDPYINHPIDVMNRLRIAGISNPEVLVAAVLHDTIEDTDTTYSELIELFGGNIADFVLEVSDNKDLSKKDRKLGQIEHAKHLSKEATLVKMADKLSNLTDLTNRKPEGWSDERVRGYFIWAHRVIEMMNDEYKNVLLLKQLDHIFKTHMTLNEESVIRVPEDKEERFKLLDNYLSKL